jgi:hypothetical protein
MLAVVRCPEVANHRFLLHVEEELYALQTLFTDVMIETHDIQKFGTDAFDVGNEVIAFREKSSKYAW